MFELFIALAILIVVVCVSIWLSQDPNTRVPKPDPIFTPQNPECVPLGEITEFKELDRIPLRDEVTDSRLERIADAVEKQNQSLSIGEIVTASEKPTPKRSPRPKKNWTKNKPN
jgi:hypothetical protein